MPRQVIRITAQRDGFRRAGVAHPKGPTDYAVDHFTREQLEAFLAEPMLSVQPVLLDDEDDGETGKSGDQTQPQANKPAGTTDAPESQNSAQNRAPTEGKSTGGDGETAAAAGGTKPGATEEPAKKAEPATSAASKGSGKKGTAKGT